MLPGVDIVAYLGFATGSLVRGPFARYHSP